MIGETGDDFVLHLEKIGCRLVEAIGPKVVPGLCVDKLDIDPHAARVALNGAFKDVADAKLLADVPDIDVLALEGEGGVARDHEGAAKPREVGGEALGDAIGEIILGGIV